MNIEITDRKVEGVGRTLQVTVPVEEVAGAEEKATRKYASRAHVPGFRPGKAPVGVVRKRFGEAIRSEALESLVQSAYKEIVEREQIKVAGQPHIHDLDYEAGKPLTFQIHLEVAPEIELKNLSGFRIEAPSLDVSDADVAEQIDNMRDQKASWIPAQGKAGPRDLVTVKLATSDDGDSLAEGREYSITLGAGQAIAGIEELIMDTEIGATQERPIRWPDDFADESQRGQTKTVRLTVVDAKTKVPPELDDSFAREVGDFDTLDELRVAVRADLEAHAKRTAESQIRGKLIDNILAANPFDVPKSWVGQLVKNFAESSGVSEAEFDNFATEFWPLAHRQVQRDLVIETLSQQENLKATEAEVDDRVSEVAARRNADPGQVYASLQKGGRMQELERSITEDKVFAWLLEKNTVE